MILLLAAAAALVCPSVRVVDGDGLWCGGTEIRLAAIDAPDHPNSRRCRRASRYPRDCDAARYFAATAALRRAVEGRRVTCAVVDASPSYPGVQTTDRYGRTVARCRVNGRDLSELQLTTGHARRWP